MLDKSRPQWWQMFLLVPLMIVLLVLEGKVASPPPVHRFLQFGIVVVTFGLMALWVNMNQVTLFNEEFEKQTWTLERDLKPKVLQDPEMLPEEWTDLTRLSVPRPRSAKVSPGRIARTRRPYRRR
jgi:hypothetical protein